MVANSAKPPTRSGAALLSTRTSSRARNIFSLCPSSTPGKLDYGGGFLTALGLARNSDLFAAGVDYHGVHDWSAFLPQWDNNTKPGAPDLAEAHKLAWESSPDASVDKWKSPVLLIHGDDDRNVPFSQTVDLVQRLRENHVHMEEMIFPDEIHGFLMWRSWIKAYGATADFFDRILAQRSK
ncbi:MAG: hypothetical protein DMG68_09050 [Acidobacteria bacterium]|nr:MAG: hypothetical protein DMG68_09050 [Acidobacteriota bacterium]